MGVFLPPVSSKCDQLLAAVLLFLIVIYFQGFRVVLPCGQQGFYPVKLFYTSDMPIILHSALIADLYVMPQLLYRRYSGNFLVNLLGKGKESGYFGHSVPADDLDYQVWLILSQIRSMDCSMWSPCCQLVLSSQRHGLRFLVHQLRLLLSSSRHQSVYVSRTFTILAIQQEQQMLMLGHRESNLHKELNRYIPAAAAFGGVCIGALTAQLVQEPWLRDCVMASLFILQTTVLLGRLLWF